MNSRYFVLCIAAAILIFFASGAVGTKTTTQWEYGQLSLVVITSQPDYSWKSSSEKFYLNREEMIKLVGVPKDEFSNIAVFNYLGKDGWELFKMPDIQVGNKTNLGSIDYYFKRCKP
jgi:hypothetical protein